MRSEVQVLLDPPTPFDGSSMAGGRFSGVSWNIREPLLATRVVAGRGENFYFVRPRHRLWASGHRPVRHPGVVWVGSQGALAQLGERLICIQEVRSSILLGSTKSSTPFRIGWSLGIMSDPMPKVIGRWLHQIFDVVPGWRASPRLYR